MFIIIYCTSIITDTRSKTAQHGQQSKFEDPTNCVIFPPAIASWKAALMNIDRSPNVHIFEMQASDVGYIVPEPASMVSTQTEEKSHSMFWVWLNLHGLCMLRILTKSSLARPMPNLSWNVLPTSEYAASKA